MSFIIYTPIFSDCKYTHNNFSIFKYTHPSLSYFLNIHTQSFWLFKYTHRCGFALLISHLHFCPENALEIKFWAISALIHLMRVTGFQPRPFLEAVYISHKCVSGDHIVLYLIILNCVHNITLHHPNTGKNTRHYHDRHHHHCCSASATAIAAPKLLQQELEDSKRRGWLTPTMIMITTHNNDN